MIDIMNKISCICASHLDHVDRLDALDRSISALKLQDVDIIISLSCDESLSETLDAHFKDSDLVIIRQPRRLSQFEHLNHVIEMNLNEWCMFFDDDDLSHPNRVKKYMDAINASHGAATVYCKNAQKSVCEQGAWRMALEDIDAYDAHIGNGGQEYYMFAVRSDVLNYFCKHCGPGILELRECDLMFRNFLRCLPCHVFEYEGWLYAKTMRSVTVPDESHMDELDLIWRTTVMPRLRRYPHFDEYTHTGKFRVMMFISSTQWFG